MTNQIVSMYWKNIEPNIVACQRRVFSHLGYEIRQVEADGVGHGDFIDNLMKSLPADDNLLLVDIDCFPMNAEVVRQSFVAADAGRIFGCAQAANHINAQNIYAGPMFLSISKQTWLAIGSPSAKLGPKCDVGQAYTDSAKTNRRHVDLIFPTISILPKWKLGDGHLFGIGTFYESKVFHLFESHISPYQFILEDVAAKISGGKDIDYIDLIKKAQFVSHFEKALKLAKRLGL